MPIGDLFGLIRKRQTTPDKYLASSVNVVAGGQNGARRAEFSQHRGIMAYRSWVYAAATINANAVASMPIRLYAKKDNGLESRAVSRRTKAYLYGDGPGDQRPSTAVLRKAAMYGDEMEEVVDHPILDVLASANPFMNGFDLSVLRVLYGELTGNSYLHPIIDEESGVPGELWPLAPQYVEVIPNEDTFIEGFVYGIDSSLKQVFTPDEVIHFKRPHPGSLYYGMGKVEAAYGVVQANQALHEMDLATFENSARPDYAVVVKGNAQGEQLDRFQTQVEQRLKGTRKDGSFITVTGDVQFTPLNFPPKDLAGREEIVEEIAAVFGVPVSMLKANDPNLASATTGFASWREGTILPLCRMDEQELNQSLLPMFGLDDSYCLAYDNPVPRDISTELSERQTAVAGGWRTPNEARLEEGREPIDNEFADQLLVGGQPLGGAAGGLLPEPEAEEPKAEQQPVVDAAASLIRSYRNGEICEYTAVKLIQTSGFTRAVAEKMVSAETKATPVYDEPDDEDEKAIADVDLKPTSGMASLAARGLELRKEHGRGGTMVGVARARDIKNRAELSPDTIGRMANFFGRHRVDLDAPAAKPGHDKYPSNGVIAWLLWGGDPNNPDEAGHAWAKRKMEELDKAKEKEVDKRYDWPEATAKYRLHVEGLADDFDRLMPKSVDADDSIRDEEKSTPASRIEKLVGETLTSVREELKSTLSSNTKAASRSIKDLIAQLEGLKGKTLAELIEHMSKAAAGGSKAGIGRINEALGSGQSIAERELSKAALKSIEKRAKMIADSLIDGTLTRFSESTRSLSVSEQLESLETSAEFAKGRSSTIARTESAEAYHEGQMDAWKQSDMVEGKHFLVAPGACQFCKAIGNEYGPGKKVLPLDSPVLKSGQTIKGTDGGTMNVKIDSNGSVHPNCRCDTVAKIKGL